MLSLEEYSLLGLFLTCFLAATILPFSSEIVLAGFILSGNFSPLQLVLVATVGNSLGGVTNYYLGYFGNFFWQKKFGSSWQDKKVNTWIQKYGYWTAILGWLPFVGDPLILALGFYRSKMIPTLTLMTAGKLVRYLVIIGVVG